jgi:hypothetical protein
MVSGLGFLKGVFWQGYKVSGIIAALITTKVLKMHTLPCFAMDTWGDTVILFDRVLSQQYLGVTVLGLVLDVKIAAMSFYKYHQNRYLQDDILLHIPNEIWITCINWFEQPSMDSNHDCHVTRSEVKV